MKKPIVSLFLLACAVGSAWANDGGTETFKSPKQSLTLKSVQQKTLEQNPQLHQFDFQRQTLESLRETSQLKPGVEFGVMGLPLLLPLASSSPLRACRLTPLLLPLVWISCSILVL